MVEIVHTFHSEKGDGTDPTKVQPSNWNDVHKITQATKKLLGRMSANAGPTEEIDFGVFGASIVAADTSAAAAAAGIFTTGDAKLSFKLVADAGWILLNDGSIGNAASGATTLADESAKDLFVLLWDSVADAWAPVSGGRGVTGGLNDFNAGKRMTLPKALGRAIVLGGLGVGLTNRPMGSNWGAEKRNIDVENFPDVDFQVTIPAGQGAHNHIYVPANAQTAVNQTSSDRTVIQPGGVANTSTSSLPQMSGTAASGGSDEPFEVTQPSFAINIMVKL